MSFVTFTWEGSITLRLPWSNRGQLSEFRSENLPKDPLLQNKKTIGAHPYAPIKKEEQKLEKWAAREGLEELAPAPWMEPIRNLLKSSFLTTV